ncbi:AfsR/SARP family transcriptional regulator [Peterkaempfera bronchialis]|uniref:AfsR/SARP family transcriptional regulator n=1 Tax=Peterkaempfera bronchialis TaxID=2126346 RepID=UPI0013B4123F|nr:BTAD domain-containing putative transcriptional regulator [Peterkaempfera bronchialis]
MEFRLLGPLEVWVDGRQIRLGSAKERAVLAVLICAAESPVTVDALLERVWDGNPPPSGPDTLQSYVSRLRNRLRAAAGDGVRLDFSARTYRLRTDPEAVDLQRFRRLHRQGRATAAAGDPERAVELLRDAQALWRGDALSGFDSVWATGLRSRLGEEHRAAREQRIRLELDLGRHAELIGELSELAAARPVPEPMVMDLMLALYRSGRHAESLTAYRDARARLRDELGLDPRPELNHLHQRILRRDPALAVPEPTDHAPGRASRAPDNLPRDLPDFTGRRAELEVLLAEPPSDTTSLPVTVIHGMPGVGKTTLAIRAAHLLRDRYPHGLIHLDLHAYSRQAPREPSDALALLLTLVGTPPGTLPADLDGRASLWRDRMAGSRALLVLDDVRDTAQIRPLLPGTPHCRVFITSRHRLADLEGAEPLSLDVPAAAEAVELFTRIVGASRISDPESVRQAVDLCGRHPLAVQLMANRFRHRDAWDVDDLVDRLRQSPGQPGELDTLPGVAGSFELSYSELGAAEQRLFRLLALHPGPDLTLYSATALDGRSPSDVRRSLDELTECHFMEELLRDRYCFHGLIRDFALRVSRRDDAEAERHAAMLRLLDYYLAVADDADRLVHPLRRRLDIRPENPPAARPAFTDADEAGAWMDVERSNLLAVSRTAAAHSPTHARLIPHVLAKAFYSWGAWQVADGLHQAALGAWGEDGDQAARAQILVERASMLWTLGVHDGALRCGLDALRLSRAAQDPRGQAEALYQVGRARLVSGRPREVLLSLEEALLLHRETGNRRGEAEVRNLKGIALSRAGRFHEALEQFRSMLVLELEIGDKYGQMWALNNMGDSYSRLGRHQVARSHYDQAMALVRRVGGMQELGNVYDSYGNFYRETGEPFRALGYSRKAVDLFRALNDPRSESDSLISIGLTYQKLGRNADALIHFTMAERIALRIDSRLTRQKALLGIAATRRASGQYKEALAADHEALRIARRMDAIFETAEAWGGLAQTAVALRRTTAARRFWLRALMLYQELDVPDAEVVRGHLTELGITGTGENAAPHEA